MSPARAVAELMSAIAGVASKHKKAFDTAADTSAVNLDCPFGLEPCATTLGLLHEVLERTCKLLSQVWAFC